MEAMARLSTGGVTKFNSDPPRPQRYSDSRELNISLADVRHQVTTEECSIGKVHNLPGERWQDYLIIERFEIDSFELNQAKKSRKTPSHGLVKCQIGNRNCF